MAPLAMALVFNPGSGPRGYHDNRQLRSSGGEQQLQIDAAHSGHVDVGHDAVA